MANEKLNTGPAENISPEAAEMISGQLAECGACIVSGMAYGI